ncbi:MAG TPA: hypothetical protein VMB80_12935 [Candidatus Acidoferrum sp.]|nr:hypothetical protein [Candidatus Acidoferrum sp.]
MPDVVRFWVWFCAYLNGAGWTLSALHQLNATGYGVALLVGLTGWWLWRKKASAPVLPRVAWGKFRRRFRRPFPLGFLVLAAMAFLGGVLYAPNNYDALAYRVPRVLHWLAEGRWHWIHTIFARVNTRACGIEWVSAPFIALLNTDRLLFLINTVSLGLLPGLVFSVFTRLGVRRRVAWYWMWIVSTGYGFLLQAGGIGNDLFGAIFALAALDFALRVNVSRSARDFFTAIVAAGMLTACKLSDLTLLLPWALAMLPVVRLGFRWPVRTAAVCALALTASLLPTAVEDFRHTGDWTGMEAEHPGVSAPIFKTGVNIFLAASQNFCPPVFPWTDQFNRLVDEKLPPKLVERLDNTLEAPCRFHLEQMQTEENGGLGFGVATLLSVSVIAAFFSRPKPAGSSPVWLAWIRWSSLISLLALLTQSNLYRIGRLLTPYYALLLPPLLACDGHEQLVKKCWWRRAAGLVFVLAAVLLVVSPARPLFPVQTILAHMRHVSARVEIVYSVYRDRNDAFAPARGILPPDVKILGLVTYDDPETSLWRPFGARRIVHVCPADTAADLKQQGIEYVLLNPDAPGTEFGPLDPWLKRMNAQIVQKFQLTLRAAVGPVDWYLVKLN